MSVLVRGMEMPMNCGTCHLRKSNEDRVWCPILGEYICFETEFIGRKTNCPLVEIETPHGRLGDLDKLWDRMYNYIDNEGAKMPFGDNDFMIHRDSACELVEDAPTIIEAEGSNE